MLPPLAMQSPRANFGVQAGPGIFTPTLLTPAAGVIVGARPGYGEIIDSQRQQPPMLANAPLEVIRNALDTVMYGGASIPLYAEHHLAAASTDRLRQHAEMLLSVIGPSQIGMPVPSNGVDLASWILQVQRIHLEPHRPKLSSVRVSPPVSCNITPVVTPVASLVPTPTTSFVPPVMRSTPPATPHVSFTPPPSFRSPLTVPVVATPATPARGSCVPDELEFVMVGGVEVPFFLESQLRALHPLKLRSHAMALQRTLPLPAAPAREEELVPWVLAVQSQHLASARAPRPVATATAAPVIVAPALQPVAAPSMFRSPSAPSPAAVWMLPSTPATVASLASSTETLPRGLMATSTLAQAKSGAYNNAGSTLFGQPCTYIYGQEATPPTPLRNPKVVVPVQTLQSTAPAVYESRIAGRLTPPPSWTPDPGPAAQNGERSAAGASLEGNLAAPLATVQATITGVDRNRDGIPDVLQPQMAGEALGLLNFENQMRADQLQQKLFNDMNGVGRTPSLGPLAPGALWNAGGTLSDTLFELNGTGFGAGSSRPPEASSLGAPPTAGFGLAGMVLPSMQSTVAPSAAATAPAGGNGLIGSMLAYSSPFSQAAAAIGSNPMLENGGGMQNGGVEQVAFFGIMLPFFSEQQLQSMNSWQLREQANLLFKTIGAERIGTIIPPLDNDLLTWVRWVQMVHLDPLRRTRGDISTQQC